jgi:DNA-binding CsgD family transcriptional regulator
MLHGDYLAVAQTQTMGEFRTVVERFAQRLGFKTVSAVVIVDGADGGIEAISVDNTPSGYAHIFNDKTIGARCPVMQHCKRHSLPIIWDQRTYLAANAMDRWESQAQYGYRTGIAMAMHMPLRRHFVFGLDRDRSLPTNPIERMRMVADVQLFTACAQERAIEIFLGEQWRGHAPMLTSRELETLKWTMDGKTASEVGDRLGIAERTVNMHSRHAIKKLGCASKHQAVLKALRLGLIG